MLKWKWWMTVFLVICSVLFIAGWVSTWLPSYGYEVPAVWLVVAFIGAVIGLAGLIVSYVWHIILSNHAMKAFEEAMKAGGGKTAAEYIQALGEETIKILQANGEETIERIKKNGEEALRAIQVQGSK